MQVSRWPTLALSKLSRIDNHWFDAAWITLIAILGALVYCQGWRSNPMKSPDTLPYYQGAWELVARGQLINHGSHDSYGLSFNPPGLVFFYALGAFLESDPRLWELPGLLVLLVLELLFLYLIVRWVFTRPLALAAVAAVGISLLGNPGYWTSGQPAFILSTLYFLLRWVKNRSTWALSIAVVITAFALYAYFQMLPFALLIPVIWIVYRPPVSIRKLILAFIIAVLIWVPYLEFEFPRGFMDLRTMILRENVLESQGGGQGKPTRCYTSVAGLSDTLEGSYIDRGAPEGEALPIVYPGAGLVASSRYKLCTVFDNLDRNFDTDYFSLGVNQTLNSALWLLFISGLVTMAAAALARWRLFSRWLSRLWTVKWGYILAGALLGGVVIWGLLNPAILDSIRARLRMDREWLGVFKQLRSFAPLIWGALLWGTYAGKRWAASWREGTGVVALGLAVPWLLLVLLAEPNRSMRFWYLWPLEILAVLIAVESFRIAFPRWSKGSVALLVAAVLLMLPISYWRPKLLSWSRGGFGGESTGRLEAADFVGHQGQLRGATAMFIGYDVAEADWSMEYKTTHQESFQKGAWIDFLLLSRHGVVNLDQSEQRLSSQDDFRIFEHPNGEGSSLRAGPDWPGYSIVARFNSYDVYGRVAK